MTKPTLGTERARVVAVVDKGATEEIRVALDWISGGRVVDVRMWWRHADAEDGEEWVRSKRGITVAPARAAEIARGIHAALELIRKEEARIHEPTMAKQPTPEGGPGQAVRLTGESESPPAPGAAVVKPYAPNPLPRAGPRKPVQVPGVDNAPKWPLDVAGTPDHLREDGGADSTVEIESDF